MNKLQWYLKTWVLRFL